MLGAEADKWCLADGRDVTGSAYAALTGQNNVPDLRGAFLRMAGQNAGRVAWNGGTLGGFNEYKTARPRNTAFTGNTSSDGGHQHDAGPLFHQPPLQSGSGSADVGSSGSVIANTGTSFRQYKVWGSLNGSHSHTVSINGGDDETAPRSYSVNWFIKIK